MAKGEQPSLQGCKFPKYILAKKDLLKITIDPSFTFTTESVIFVKKPANTMLAANLASLITDEEDHPSLLRHEDVTPQVIRPMHGQRPPGLAHEQYTLRPVSIFEEKNAYLP